MFISCQPKHGIKKLEAALVFWHERNYRWSAPFKRDIPDIPKSSLAEAAHAKMKSGGRKNMSLVDAAYADIEAAAFFEASWRRRKEGERSHGRGPTGIELNEKE